MRPENLKNKTIFTGIHFNHYQKIIYIWDKIDKNTEAGLVSELSRNDEDKYKAFFSKFHYKSLES